MPVALGPWFQKRRNLFDNPRAIGLGFFGAGSLGNRSSLTGLPEATSTAYRWTRTTATTAARVADLTIGTSMPNGGATVTAAGRVRSSVAGATIQVSARPSLATSSGQGALGTIIIAEANVWQEFSLTGASFTASAVSTSGIVAVHAGTAVGATFDFQELRVEAGNGGLFYYGGTPATETERYSWSGTADASDAIMEIREPSVTPIKTLTTGDILYGDRITSYRWEVLSHSNGVDQLVGILDGVSDGSLTWVQNAAVKGGGKAEVVDLDVAAQGMWKISDLALESVRLRPVCVIAGLPENPLGVFLISNAQEAWEGTGRVWNLELLDKCTVPAQDLVDQSYAVPAGGLILQTVKSILAGCGEFIAINDASTIAASSGMVWEAGTSKLKIINDLLDVAGYNALWMDGYGNFQLTPRVLPADRSITYEVLGIPRELVDGQKSIYLPDWERNRDSFEVPNKVIAVQAAGGDDVAALVGQWTNEDPSSPYSYIARGRWITYVLTDVETPELSDPDTITFLSNRARATLIQMSAVQAQVKVSHLPIPVRVSDVLRFAHSRAKVDDRHVITRIQLDTTPLGLMQTNLQEVISL